MPKKDLRVDDYIAKSAEFAKPILKQIRKTVHTACPEVEETIKWGFPHFDYKGTLCSMASFKQHCAFGFWKGKLIEGLGDFKSAGDESAMGQLGRITSISDLPGTAQFTQWIKKAMELNESGVKIPKKKNTTPTKLTIPSYFKTALAKNKRAQAVFDSLAPSHKKEYIEWITEAKTEDTRERRLKQAIEWMSEGKSRNWKYERK
jgi:uncharacterized protein YdeI (YjbR/CyaY-like superfamily)